ncbi:hypothetical protein [Streptomyces sp. NPDC018610]|uniref:hypothetical protein n=1 Tax=Streptomyces sp. NPDC018610 TaxID=3365049 RepID=UPI0037AC1D59
MAKRGRTSPRQRVAREAARRAAAAVRLATAVPPRPRRQPPGAVAEVPAPARAADDIAARVPSPAVAVCAPECRVCAEAAGGYGALRAESLAQRRRFEESGHRAYAAEKQTLHRGDCKKVEQSIARVAGDDRAWERDALPRFAHGGRLDPEWATHMRMLEPGEAAVWVKERVGPRGGARYRLCRTCAPELP